MYCSKCGKENSSNAKFCKACGTSLLSDNIVDNTENKTTNTPSKQVPNAMAKICVHVKPYLPLLYRRPWGKYYKVYIIVDDTEYMINSREKYSEITVVPGSHTLHIDSRSKKERTRNQVLEAATHMCGGYISAIWGYSFTIANYLQDYTMTDGKIELKPGESMELKLCCNNLQQIVWWNE